MVERGLRAAGYRTGRYTSPHLVDLEERFAIDGRPITPATFDAVARRVRDAASQLAVAAELLRGDDGAGARGVSRRAASTSPCSRSGSAAGSTRRTSSTPIAVAITAIDFDHEQYLGNTIEEIAAEKAGVIKPGVAGRARRRTRRPCSEVVAGAAIAPAPGS